MKLKNLNLKNTKLDIGFNRKLYLDGIRQLKQVGMMGLVVLCASALLTAVGYHINTSGRWYNEFGNLIERAPQGVSLFQCHWALFLTFPILVPIMTMILFNFMNHRNASDFYHSIPDTRGTVYISYAAAILSWIGAIIGISTLLSVFCISILPGYYVLWSGVAKSLFLIISACVLVMGGVTIALGLTGTRMSNLLVTLIILFLPRVFVSVVMYILEEMMPFVAWEYSSSLFNPRYDLIAGILLSLFSGINPFQYGSSGVYSLFLGLIYLAAGYVIFVRRKSERAGHAAITPKMQSVFRLAVSLTICLLPIYYISGLWADQDSMDIEELFAIVVFYVIAVLAYFIYELMTTGKLRSFKKLCKGIGVLAGLNVAVFVVIASVYGVTMKDVPSGDDIDYIMIRGSERDYFEAQLQRIRIRDDEVAEITSNALKKTIQRYRDNNYNVYDGQNTVTKTVAINVGMRTMYRDVIYTVSDWNKIVESLSERPEYYQVYCDLPEFDGNEMSIYSNSRVDLGKEQLIKIYNVMREEVKTLNFEEWYSAIGNYYYGEDSVDEICITLNVGNTGNRDTIYLPILFSMPKTLTCYFEEMNKVDYDTNDAKIWEIIHDLSDGMSFDGYKTDNLSINVNMSLIGKGVSLDYIDGSIAGYQEKEGMRITPYGIVKEGGEENFLTVIDNLFEGAYPMEVTADAWLKIDLDAYAYAYADNGDKRTYSVNGQFFISLSDPIPEELSELLGDYLEKYEANKPK